MNAVEVELTDAQVAAFFDANPKCEHCDCLATHQVTHDGRCPEPLCGAHAFFLEMYRLRALRTPRLELACQRCRRRRLNPATVHICRR